MPQAPDDKALILPAYDGFSVEGEDNEVLKIITQGQHVAIPVKDWKYEWRRQAQPILSFLYLGPSSAARNIEMMRQEGITMLLVIRDNKTAMASLLSGQKVANQLGIQAASIDVSGHYELIAAFPRAIKIINDHLISIYRRQVADGASPDAGSRNAWGKILVFCESGNERSAAVVAAYLMNMYAMDLVSAIQYIQSQRFCVAFDDGLKNMLYNYHQLLEAQKAVSASSMESRTRSPSRGPTKRGRDEMDDDDSDMTMDHLDDSERFGGRTSFVPFQDDKEY